MTRAPWVWAIAIPPLLASCGEIRITLGRDADPDSFVPLDAPRTSTGCADGEREGFVDPERYGRLAACGGGFDVPGVRSAQARVLQCGREGGDDGPRPNGAGCSVADLCAEGWHVCESGSEVAERLPSGATCSDVLPTGFPLAFFVTRQSGVGSAQCGEGDNDLFGCGTHGDHITSESCAPLDRYSFVSCRGLRAPWECPGDGSNEAQTVVKRSAELGGVLCCADR